MFKNAIILSGGLGYRMKPITEYVPKALVKVNNVFLIDHVINFLNSNHIENIYITYGYKGEMLVEELENRVSGFINTKNKDNSYFLFNSIIKYIDEPIIISPCDVIIDLNLKKVYDEYVELGSPPACIIPIDIKLEADKILHSNNIVDKISRECESSLFASGIQILNPKKINDIILSSDNFYNVWNSLINLKSLYVVKTMPTKWKVFDKLTDLI
jgi:MurNAc alpha-1-phosphate uridylyltransferase